MLVYLSILKMNYPRGVLVGIGIKVGKIRRIEGSTLETAVGSDEGTTDGSRIGILDRFNSGCDEG